MAKLCPQCENENPSAANVCMYCGTRLVEDVEMDKMDALHNELSDAKDTIKVLKDALKEKEKQEAEVKKEAIKRETVTIPPPPVSNFNTTQKVVDKENKPFPYTILFAGLALLIIVGGSIGYFAFYKPYAIDRDAPRFYTFATSTFLRSTQEAGVEYNKLSSVPYGSELIVYNKRFDWSEVKWKDSQTQKAIKGYISSAYTLPVEDFKILNNVWGDNESKEIINTTKCRLALLNYFKERGQYDWKVYSKTKTSKYNSTYYKRVVNSNSKFTDFAVIVKNNNSEERKCLLFTFDDDETPHLVYEEKAPYTGDIFSISYDNKSYPYNYHIAYR